MFHLCLPPVVCKLSMARAYFLHSHILTVDTQEIFVGSVSKRTNKGTQDHAVGLISLNSPPAPSLAALLSPPIRPGMGAVGPQAGGPSSLGGLCWGLPSWTLEKALQC